jgi:hypothetical protein
MIQRLAFILSQQNVMEIKQFQNAKNSMLEEFEKNYESLKREYSMAVMDAIEETDPEKQQQLVSRVLSINSDLSNELRNIISDMSKGPGNAPPKTMDGLTSDLIKYQQQYNDVEKGKDRLQTLKLISKSNQDKLSDTSTMFNIYIGVLVFLVFIIGYLVIRTNWRHAYSAVSSALPSGQMLSSS